MLSSAMAPQKVMIMNMKLQAYSWTPQHQYGAPVTMNWNRNDPFHYQKYREGPEAHVAPTNIQIIERLIQQRGRNEFSEVYAPHIICFCVYLRHALKDDCPEGDHEKILGLGQAPKIVACNQNEGRERTKLRVG
eukprot:347990-Amorphochlora_amoeboformis.AAC.1